MKINEIIVEGWGAETQKAQHDKNMVAVAKVLQKYQDDPELSAIASYMFQNNWAADAIDKTLQGQGKYDVDWWKATMAKKPQFQNHTQMMIDKYLSTDEAFSQAAADKNKLANIKLGVVGRGLPWKQYTDMDELATDIAYKITKNPTAYVKLLNTKYNSSIAKAIDKYFQKYGYPDSILNKVSDLIINQLQADGRKPKPEPKKKAPMPEDIVGEEPASRALCTSGKPDSALGASQLASCKSQGYRSRDGGKSHKVGSERVKVRGKRIKGKKYGGPLPDWS